MTGRAIQKHGQHFLISPRVITEIVDAAEVLKAVNLVEIGPGQGDKRHHDQAADRLSCHV